MRTGGRSFALARSATIGSDDMHRAMPFSFTLAMLLFAAVPAPGASETAPANVKIFDLQQTQAALRETYPHKKKMGLPRMVMLNADGRVLYGGMGLPNDLGYVLHKAYKEHKPLDTPITLEAILDETQRADGTRVHVGDLPKADAYIVDYWAGWCAPCRMMSRDLKGIMSRWSDMQFVWIKIESDPEKLHSES
jgi:hypothetical protein